MRKRTRCMCVIVAVVMACALLIAAPARAQADEPDNLLINGSLEAPYTERTGRVWVAHGWEWAAWDRYMPTISDGGSAGPIIRPEYKQLTPAIDARRVIDGGSAQCWFWAFAVGDAVVYQVVDVEIGQRYKADAWAQSWVANTEDFYTDGEMNFTIGLDPEGGTQPWATGVIWAPYQWSGYEYRQIKSREVVATTTRMTVFLRATSKWAKRHNDAYWDQARLYRAGDAAPLPTPTIQPSPTPQPTPQPGQCPSADEIARPILEALPQIVYEAVWRVLRELMPALAGG